MIEKLAARFGFVRKADVINKLQFARSVGKRLDEHREVVQAIQESTQLFIAAPWHAGHMATQDDYLMRLYNMVHGCWPDDSIRHQKNGEVVRARPMVLGECRLPEYEKAEQAIHCVRELEPFPFAAPHKFQVMRGDVISDRIATSGEVAEFLDACQIVQGSQNWEAAFAGVPIQVDGTTIRFNRI